MFHGASSLRTLPPTPVRSFHLCFEVQLPLLCKCPGPLVVSSWLPLHMATKLGMTSGHGEFLLLCNGYFRYVFHVLQERGIFSVLTILDSAYHLAILCPRIALVARSTWTQTGSTSLARTSWKQQVSRTGSSISRGYRKNSRDRSSSRRSSVIT